MSEPEASEITLGMIKSVDDYKKVIADADADVKV